MISGQVGILSAIVIYLLAMVYVGFYFSKKAAVIPLMISIWAAESLAPL